MHSVGQLVGHDVEFVLNRLRDIQGIGHRLLDDAEGNKVLALEAGNDPLVLDTQFGLADIGKAHQEPVGGKDDEVVELLGRRHIGHRTDGKLALLALDASGGNLDVLVAQCRLDVLDGQVVGRQLERIEPDAHGIAALAENHRLGDTRQGL